MISKQVIFVLFRSETFTVAAKLRLSKPHLQRLHELDLVKSCRDLMDSGDFTAIELHGTFQHKSADTSVVSENAATLICCKAPEMLKKLNPIFRQHAVDEIMTEFLKFFG